METSSMYQTTPYNTFNRYRNEMLVDSSNVNDSFHPRLGRIIAIGNPIVDILAETDKETLQRFKLIFGGTFFANDSNMGFFDELESKPQVTYIPGGSIQNTLRVASWCLNMEKQNENKFYVTMLGAIGQDNYQQKIMKALELSGVKPLLQPIPNISTSRCGVGICQKERCLLPHIKASNCLTEEFVKEHEDEIFNNDALLIEGYFLQEKYELCKDLCNMFKRAKKMIILTLSAVFMVQSHREKIMEIAQNSDMVVGNLEEFEAFAEVQRTDPQTTIAKAHEKLSPKERLFVVTDGANGVYVTKYDYNKKGLDYFLQSFPKKLKNEDICDLNGAGDAFLGGFLSQYMKGASLEQCCKVGNDASYIIIKNVGCTFPKNKIIKSIGVENNSLIKI